MTPAPLSTPWTRLPRLALPEAHAALHAWLGDRLSAELPTVTALLGAPPRLTLLRLSAVAPAPRPQASTDALDLWLATPDGGRAVLRLGGDLTATLLAALQANPAPRIPGPLRAGEAGALAGVVAATLADLAPPGLVLSQVHHAPPDGHWPEGPWALACSLRWSLAQGAGGLEARVDDLAADVLRRVALAQPPPVREARARALPLTARFLALRTPMAAADLAALAPGDVLACPGTPPASAGTIHGWLDTHGWLAPATLQRTATGRRIVLAKEVTPVPTTPTTPTTSDAPLSPDAAERLHRLPVTLTVSLGRLTLSAADVARLAPGAVVELDRPVGEPVSLCADGQPIARGELVAVDGCLGVRVIELLG